MNNRLLLTAVITATLTLLGCDSLLYSNTLAPVFSANKTQVTPPPTLPSSGTVDSIEQPNAATGIIIQRDETSPYSTAPARPDAMTNMPQSQEATVATQENVGATTPQIREGSEVLASDGTAKNTPVQPLDKTVQRPSTTVSQQTATATATTNATTVVKPAPATPKSATRALLQEAKDAVASGEYDKAASALERAHRIEPGNAKILYDIAQIRYAQGNYRQASSFASKAATYSSNPTLSKKVWTLLSNARKQLGNSTGAAAAAQKAASF